MKTIGSPMTEQIRLLLDTHILVWFLDNSNELSSKIKNRIETAANQNSIFLSAISIWEIAQLESKKRIQTEFGIEEYVQRICDIQGINLAPLTPDICCLGANLPNFHKDPSDRIIVATSLILNAKLVTSDRHIIGYPKLRNLIEPI